MEKKTNASQPASMNNENLLNELRQKTRDLEEVGVKIDEFTRVNQDTQRIFNSLGRFD